MSKSVLKNMLVATAIGVSCMNAFSYLPSFAESKVVTPDKTTQKTPTKSNETRPTSPSSTERPATERPTTERSTTEKPGIESKETKPTSPSAAKSNTIVDIASSNKSFSILVTALKAAGLVETLSGEGPFTVFAPTDEAFEALPKGTLEMLLKPENKDKLVKILTYHVVSGSVLAKDVKSGNVKTVEGASFAVKADAGKVMINNANVLQTDVAASNGIIHVIDKVIVPPNL